LNILVFVALLLGRTVSAAVFEPPDTKSVLVYLYEANRFDEAEALALRIHQNGRHDPNVHLVLGKIYWRQGKKLEMVRQLEVFKEAPPSPLREEAEKILAIR
jgi:hypothetical protein